MATDYSNYLVHFTKGGSELGYETVLDILFQGKLLRGPGPFGAARDIEAVRESQRAVCFSEIPPGFLGRLADRRSSEYAIMFKKRLILDKGGAPVWYLEDRTSPAILFKQLITHHKVDHPPSDDSIDPLWRLTPFVDYPSGPTSPYTYDFRWEREWRLTSDLEFSPQDVAALIIPEELHADAREFFKDHGERGTGPDYTCRYIDARWPPERSHQALLWQGAR